MTTQPPSQRYSTCTATTCAGVEIEGHVLRCPNCQGTLVQYHIRREPMTTVAVEARANDRAHVEHVHIFRVPGRPGVYTTRSKSNHAERYALVARDGVEACSCKGFEYRGSCKHVEALRNRLAREAVRMTVTTVAALAGKEAA